MYITYSTHGGEAIRTYRTKPLKVLTQYCLRFRDWETANAAWIADATVYQAINAFGGTEVYGAIAA